MYRSILHRFNGHFHVSQATYDDEQYASLAVSRSNNKRISWRGVLRGSVLVIGSMSAPWGNTYALALPEVFAPGVISGPAAEACPAFSPDGNTVYYDLSNQGVSVIVTSHRSNGVWSTPKIAPFSGVWLDHDVAMAPDGSFIVFVSNRPAQPGGGALAAIRGGRSIPNVGGNLWRVNRAGEGWSEPERLPDIINSSTRTYAPSIAGDGSLYYIQPDQAEEMHIFRSQYRDGQYQKPVQQTLGDPSAHNLDPAIASDESFLIFNANYADKKAPDRLYISFREGDHWGKPADMGDEINAGNSPWGAHLSPDQHTLYFTSDRSRKVSYPLTRAQVEQDLLNMQSWDNGQNNIWFVSIASWLEAHKTSGKGS